MFLRAKPRPIADPNGGSASAPKVRRSFGASEYPRPYPSTTTQIQPTSEVTSILLAADDKKSTLCISQTVRTRKDLFSPSFGHVAAMHVPRKVWGKDV